MFCPFSLILDVRLLADGHQRLLSDPVILKAVLELVEQVPQASLKALAS